MTQATTRLTPPPSLQLYYQLFIHDANGKLVRRSRKLKSRSFVRQFLQSTLSTWKNAALTGLAFVDTADVNQILNTNNIGRADGAAAVVTRGIVVGTGTNAVAVSDNKLQTLIATGTGAGQLQYQTQLFDANVSLSGLITTFAMSRAYINGSGGSITINEIGIYLFVGGAFSICAIRDKLAAGQAVADVETLTVVYTVKTTA